MFSCWFRRNKKRNKIGRIPLYKVITQTLKLITLSNSNDLISFQEVVSYYIIKIILNDA